MRRTQPAVASAETLTASPPSVALTLNVLRPTAARPHVAAVASTVTLTAAPPAEAEMVKVVAEGTDTT